ncbi:anti-sigma F factor antagonist [Ornithinibacillus sp. 4-3]|uniref:Anti-sigma F factor antagonist n=1 Tax=Ornithinibacillus sp. 4-3 TaxID=3231488 RepID=A0AB39HN94_9BACI
MSFSKQFSIKEDVLIVRLGGELDHHEADQLKTEWHHMLHLHEIKHTIVNLQSVTFMDSSGIGVILGRYKEVVQLGGELIVCSVPTSIQKIFLMSGIYKIIRQEASEEYALHSLGVAS